MCRIQNGKYNNPIGIILAVMVLVVFWNVPSFSFINYDDTIYVTRNSHVLSGLGWGNVVWAFTTLEAGFWHPLTWLSLMLDYELYGLHAGGYHWTNVLLHIGNTLLLFWALARMTGAPWRSGIVAALFALHPLHVESVAWVAQRKDVLSTFFWMLTLVWYARYVERPVWWRYVMVLGAFILGLMSKPMLVTLPFVLLLLDYWPLNRLRMGGVFVAEKAGRFEERSLSYLLAEKIPLIVLSLLSIGLTFHAEKGVGAVVTFQMLSWDARIANAFISYITYIGKMFWPVNLAVFYPHPGTWPPWLIGFSVLVLALFTSLTLFSIKKHPFAVVGWFWYLATLVPMIGLVQIGAHALADRYTYVPLIGLFIVLAWAMPDGIKLQWRQYAAAVSFTILILLGYLSSLQTGYWLNDLTLFRHAIDVTRDNYVAESIYGSALMEKGRTQEALRHFRRSLQIKPNYEPVYYNMASFYQKMGKYDEAI
jgi:protein O-mannosyl-transferase